MTLKWQSSKEVFPQRIKKFAIAFKSCMRIEYPLKKKPAPPREDEIAERLAKLRGRTNNPVHDNFQQADTRSSVQKEDDMIREAQDKIRLDGLMSDPDEEIMSRLAKLRGNCTEDSNIIKGAADNTEYSNIIKAATVEMECDTKESIDEIMKKTEKDAREGVKDIATDKELSKKIKDIHLSKETTSSPMDDIEQQNEENESKKVLQQILDEVAIEEKLGQIEELPTPDGDPITIMNKYTQRQIQKQINEEESECPWCVICNEDASIRCIGCESDLYCPRCFKECHDDFDAHDHKTTKFAVGK
uniref:Zinc finger FYVE domain-containing protein 19 n=1 Tax=Lepeophtheirus salmonis TaxID=72036 RepID=C1BV75_LEPSM|nr:Zinc finger FYVE domain-containing protein 19 [Lepeophtheirus salmonis]